MLIPSSREIFNQYSFFPSRKLGQHFLINDDVLENIVDRAREERKEYFPQGSREKGEWEEEGDTVVEIGSGPGGLTRAIAMRPDTDTKRVISIEKDKKFTDIMETWKNIFNNKIITINADALKINYMEDIYNIYGRFCIIANLPYNIGTRLIVDLLYKYEDIIDSITVLLQKEVVQRMVSRPRMQSFLKKQCHGHKPELEQNYGCLSVLLQKRANIKLLCHIPANAFIPPPKVVSSLVQITPLPFKTCFSSNLEKNVFLAFVKGIFLHRRKKIKKYIESIFEKDTNSVVEKLKIDTSLRPENISVDMFSKIAREIIALNSISALSSYCRFNGSLA